MSSLIPISFIISSISWPCFGSCPAVITPSLATSTLPLVPLIARTWTKPPGKIGKALLLLNNTASRPLALW